MNDKLTERDRYDVRAKNLLNSALVDDVKCFSKSLGSSTCPLHLRSPYTYYEALLEKHIQHGCRVLEIGSGTGANTMLMLSNGAQVTATDISAYSLEVLRRRYTCFPDLQTKVADMESLPFKDEFFDIVTSAGSLSYGDPALVIREIRRVLRPGGCFIAVDSFNENPIYRFNRWLHYLRGNRSKSTLLRMPNKKTIQAYRDSFGCVEVRYFGSIAWLSPLMRVLMGSRNTKKFIDRFDNWCGVDRSAFKFVMVATKTTPTDKETHEH